MTDEQKPNHAFARSLSNVELESKLLTGTLRILGGINMTETESKSGWWETSKGAEFGNDKLLELIKFMSETVRSNIAIQGREPATQAKRPAGMEG